MNQLDRIMEVTGRPSPEDIDAIKSPFAATMLDSLNLSRPRPLNEMFPTASVEALDLFRLCMQFNPTKRPAAKDTLGHPYVVQFHSPEDEFDCDRPIRIPIDDNTKLTVEDYRDRLYNEVLRKKKEQRRSHRRQLEMQQQQMGQQPPQQQYAPQGAPGSGQGHRSSHSAGSHSNGGGGVAPSSHAAYGQPAYQQQYAQQPAHHSQGAHYQPQRSSSHVSSGMHR